GGQFIGGLFVAYDLMPLMSLDRTEPPLARMLASRPIMSASTTLETFAAGYIAYSYFVSFIYNP
ncbi:MAG: hypothetical protein ACJARI_002692, partial [Bacteroidia bacterium]